MLKNETGKTKKLLYKVADLYIEVLDDVGINEKLSLPNFLPFQYQEDLGISSSLRITLKQMSDCPKLNSLKLLIEDIVPWDDQYKFEETQNLYITSIIGTTESNTWKMLSSRDFLDSTIFVNTKEVYSTTKLSWLIMVAFGQACLNFNVMLIHASVVEFGNAGYAFLGKSGTGKSTHSSLWVQHKYGARLLNDDSPAIQILPTADIFICGTPWSGKKYCFKNKKIPLTAITRLSQAPRNAYFIKTGMQALLTLLPSGSAIRWNCQIFSKMVTIMEQIVNQVPIGILECLPEKDSVEVHYNAIQGKPNQHEVLK